MAKIVKVRNGVIGNDSRNYREIHLLQEMGHDVIYVGISNKDSIEVINGVETHFRKIKYSSNSLYRKFQIIRFNLRYASYIRSLKADCISGYDISGLLIGWLSNIRRKNKAKLVYDSHEFELGRNARRSKFRLWAIKQLEGFLIKRSAFCIMVNDSIADEVSRIYNLKERPIVVRSTPSNWKINKDKCKEIRQYYLSSLLGVNHNCFICMYHGAITTSRGIEELIEVISKTENTVGVILGDGLDEYILKLKKLTSHLKVNQRVLFLPAVQLDQLVNYIGASDCGIIVPQVIYKSYYHGLPNKFFENIQSLTPIICNNTPAMADIITHYTIGLTIDPPGSVEATVQAVNQLSTDKELFRMLKSNLIQAKNELCWENEKERLRDAYLKILSPSDKITKGN